MTARKTIVIVQGAFQTPEFYAAFESRLQELGFDIEHPELPTCTDVDDDDFPMRTVRDDANAIHTAVKRLVEDEAKPVVVLMHSYGGLPGTEAITSDLAYESRKAKGLQGGVVQQVYFGSVAPLQGVSSKAIRGGEWPEEVDVHEDGRYYYMPHERLFADFSDEDKSKWSGKIIPHSAATLTYETTNASWKFLPTTAIVFDRDVAISTLIQESQAKRIGAKIVHLDVAHETFVINPDIVAAKVQEVIDD